MYLHIFLGLLWHMLFCYWSNLITVAFCTFVPLHSLSEKAPSWNLLSCMSSPPLQYCSLAWLSQPIHISLSHCYIQWSFWKKEQEDISLSEGALHLLFLKPAEVHVLKYFSQWALTAKTGKNSLPVSRRHLTDEAVSVKPRLRGTNFPSKGCSSFLEICHWGIFWLRLYRHLLFTDIAFLTGGITEVVLHWQYLLARSQSDSSSISLQGLKTAAAVIGLQLLWGIMIKLYLLKYIDKYSLNAEEKKKKCKEMKSLAMH